MVRLLDQIRTSLWFLPSLMCVAAVSLALVTLYIDRSIDPTQLPQWLTTDSATGARALLGSITGSLITVTGMVFSITVVALSFSSNAFGPRLLRRFIRDRSQQLVLGSVLGTFLFSLIVMRAIEGEEADAFIPQISVAMSVGLSATVFVLLAAFLHRVAMSLQADQVVAELGEQVRRAIDERFDDCDASEDENGGGPRADLRALVAADDTAWATACPEPHRVLSSADGYLMKVDYDALLKLAVKHNAAIRCLRSAGQFVSEDEAVAECNRGEDDESFCEEMEEAFVIGPVRTETQDVEFRIHAIVEIAVRALSPGINDPYTAVACVDQLSSILVKTAGKKIEQGAMRDESGQRRVWADLPDFSDVMDSAWNQIRQYSCEHVAVAIRMLEAFQRICPFVKDAERLESVRKHADLVLESCCPSLESDRMDIKERHQRVLDLVRNTEKKLAPTSRT